MTHTLKCLIKNTCSMMNSIICGQHCFFLVKLYLYNFCLLENYQESGIDGLGPFIQMLGYPFLYLFNLAGFPLESCIYIYIYIWVLTYYIVLCYIPILQILVMHWCFSYSTHPKKIRVLLHIMREGHYVVDLIFGLY